MSIADGPWCAPGDVDNRESSDDVDKLDAQEGMLQLSSSLKALGEQKDSSDLSPAYSCFLARIVRANVRYSISYMNVLGNVMIWIVRKSTRTHAYIHVVIYLRPERASSEQTPGRRYVLRGSQHTLPSRLQKATTNFGWRHILLIALTYIKIEWWDRM